MATSVVQATGVSADDSWWQSLAEDLRGRDTTRLRRVLDPRLTSPRDLDRLGPLAEDAAGDATAVDALEAVVTAIATELEDQPAATAAFVAYACAVALDIWERTDGDGVAALASAVDDAFRPVVVATDDDDAQVLDALVDYLVHIDDAMSVENALNCSCPIDLEVCALVMVVHAEDLLRRLRGRRSGPAVQLAKLADIDRVYFGAVAAAARGAAAYIAGARADLDRAIASVRDATSSPLLEADVYASELRSHLATLEEMHDRGWPRLHVAQAKVIYCYPFVLTETSPDEIEAWATEESAWRELCVPVTVVRETPLTDLWRRDPEGQRDGEFRCVSIVLPHVGVRSIRGKPIENHRAEIRLSRLGNHYLRIERELRGADLHDVHQAMRRATDQMGTETVWCGGLVRNGLAELAAAVIQDVGGVVRSRGDREIDVEPGTAHVVLSIRALEVQSEPGAKPRPARPEDLHDAVGLALFAQPIRQAATTLEEWVRYPLPDPLTNVLGDHRFDGDFAFHTSNTTVLWMPGTPDFLVLDHEEMAEFVATLPTLLIGWREEMARVLRDTESDLRDLRKPIEKLTRPLASSHLQRIADKKMDLHDRVSKGRSLLAALHSASLCLTPVQRDLLDAFYGAAHLPQLEVDLERQFGLAELRLDHLLAHRARVTDELQRRADLRHERNMQLLEIFIAGLGLIALADLANTAFGWQGGHVFWREVAVIAVVTTLVAAWVHAAHERRAAGD